MRATLKAGQKLENDKPEDHYRNGNSANNPEPLLYPMDAEDPPVEEENTELDAGQRRGACDIPSD